MKGRVQRKEAWRCENPYCGAALAVRSGDMWRLVPEVEGRDVKLGDSMVRVRCPACGKENVWVKSRQLDRLARWG